MLRLLIVSAGFFGAVLTAGCTSDNAAVPAKSTAAISSVEGSNIAGRTLKAATSRGEFGTIQFDTDGSAVGNFPGATLYGKWGIEKDGTPWVQFLDSKFNPFKQHFIVAKNGERILWRRRVLP